MKESLKICKTFVCSCGRDYSLEFSTDMVVENLVIEVSCPSCGEKKTISIGSLLSNKASQSTPSQPSPSYESIPSLSFMDSAEAQEQPSSSSESSTSSSSSEQDDALGGYSDMFGDR